MKKLKTCIGIFVIYLLFLLFAVSINYGMCTNPEPFEKLFIEVSLVYGVILLAVLLFYILMWCFEVEVSKDETSKLTKSILEYNTAKEELEELRKKYENNSK